LGGGEQLAYWSTFLMCVGYGLPDRIKGRFQLNSSCRGNFGSRGPNSHSLCILVPKTDKCRYFSKKVQGTVLAAI
jgi:hypothetical protein